MTTVPHGPTMGNRLVVLAPNWLGDAVMALPAIADVVRGATASVAVAARPAVAQLFRLVEGVEGTLEPTPDAIGAGQFDTALLLTNSFRTAWIVRQAGVRERWGYRAECRGPLLTRAVSRPVDLHQVAFYQHLVAQLGFANGSPIPALQPTDDLRVEGGRLLRARGWDGGSSLVAFAPGAANGRAKRWSPASFAAVATALASGDGATPVVLGAAGDRDDAAEMLAALGPAARPIDLVGETSLPVLTGVLVHCRGLVTNDSGGMHLAAALGVPVTAMFGPSNEHETRPIGQGKTAVLTHDVWCRPCMLRDCPIDHRCMRGITVDSVVSSVVSGFSRT